MEEVIADEHGAHADCSVHDPDQNELDHGHVKKVFKFIH